MSGVDHALGRREHRPVWRTGAPPLRDERFGIELRERISAPASGTP
jgi:hypothetical protein